VISFWNNPTITATSTRSSSVAVPTARSALGIQSSISIKTQPHTQHKPHLPPGKSGGAWQAFGVWTRPAVPAASINCPSEPTAPFSGTTPIWTLLVLVLPIMFVHLPYRPGGHVGWIRYGAMCYAIDTTLRSRTLGPFTHHIE